MGCKVFRSRIPHVDANSALREPQREGFGALTRHAADAAAEREVGVILPVGSGKSGLIALAPFAYRSARTLVVAPSVQIYDQLVAEFDPSNPQMFYTARNVLDGGPYPEPVPIREDRVAVSDLEESEVVVANIQALQGGERNRWLSRLPDDFFDLILVDEGHHNVADSWELLRIKFPGARVINFSATPVRADGQLMAGRIIYSYPVVRAIEQGYVKRLSALVLNPATLRYVRNDGEEREVSLEEVKRLGEEDSDFRRSIVTSRETLTTIVDASIRALLRRRHESGDPRHKIIASALNHAHCIQIVRAYRERGYRADFIHSREEDATNRRALSRLDAHDLDVIVQVRKLGEGFDHPRLSVAAVFSIFSSLSPFVQFAGRIMRAIEPNSPGHPQNHGVIVFHAGANVARRWEDFQQFSGADQEYFDQLLPMEGLDFNDAAEIEVKPEPRGPYESGVEVRHQTEVHLEEIPLLEEDAEAQDAVRLLESRGFRVKLERIPTTKFREKQAAQRALDDRVRNEVGRVLAQRGVNPAGHDLDKQRLGRENFAVVKSWIDRAIYTFLGRKARQRQELTRGELERVDTAFAELVVQAERELFDG